MSMIMRIIILFFAISLTACAKVVDKKEPLSLYDDSGNQIRYLNPTTTFDFPDPSIFREEDGLFYAFSTTSTLGNIPILKSPDLVNWEFVGDALPDSTGDKKYWAPDINKIGNKYILYVSVWAGSFETTEIIVLAADNIFGPYCNHGTLLNYKDLNSTTLCIDPELVITPNGVLYLLCGSFYTCKVRLADDGLSILPNEDIIFCKYPVEGVYYLYHNNMHYLFGSVGRHNDRSYSVVVARAEDFDGPYFTKDGQLFTENNDDRVIYGNDRFYGSGHNSEIFTDKAGDDWICYHSYDSMSARPYRYLMLSKIVWDKDGWPKLYNDTPQQINDMPKF